MVSAFWRSQSGVTSIEYALIASVISIAIITGARLLGLNLNSLFFVKVQEGLS